MKLKMDGFLLEVLRENKRLIQFYLVLALALSFFVYGNVYTHGRTVAQNQNALQEAQVEADLVNSNLTDMLTTYDVGSGNLNQYGGGMAYSVASMSNAMGISVDPAVALSVVAIGSILNEKGVTGNVLAGADFGIFNNWGARIVIFIWAIIAVTPGLLGMEVEDLNTKYLGPLLILGSEAFTLFASHSGLVAQAADGSAIVAAGNTFLLAILEFIKIVILYIAYACVRILIYALNALVLIASKINPAFSEMFKVFKVGLTVGYMSLKNAPTWVFLLLSVPLVLVGFVILKKTIIITRYFKEIYLKPFIHKIFGINKTMLLPAKMPKFLRNVIDGRSVRLIIPVYPLKKVLGHREVVKHDQWWFVVDGNGKNLYKKPLFKSLKTINLETEKYLYGIEEDFDAKIYLRKPQFIKGSFCELLTLRNSDKGALNNTITRFAFSKEYHQYFAQILDITGFEDYDLHKENVKQQRKERFNEKVNSINPFKKKAAVAVEEQEDY